MLMPKRVKYRKRAARPYDRRCFPRQYRRLRRVRHCRLCEPGWITGNQIEAARIAMTRYTKRGGKVWIKIFPDKPVSKKALRYSNGFR